MYPMESLEEARAIYEETAKSGEFSADALAGKLNRQSDDASKEVAVHLNKAAKDMRDALNKYSPTMKKLEGDTAGEAKLDSSSMWIDPEKIISDDSEDVIDKELAEDIGRHENEHQKQSTSADADKIQVKSKTWDEREIREAAANSVMHSTERLNTEYKAICALTMDEKDRDLVRRGEFKELEKRKNGNQFSNVA